MASRPYWKGFIRFSLVSVPVQAFTAAVSESGKIRFNQLHKDCNQRVQYRKTCPVHGELRADEIVSGYEFAENQYVIVDDAELNKLRTPRDRAIDIAGFIASDAIDPRYLTDRHYYLTPDGPVAQKPYAILHRAMAEKGQHAFAKVVLSNREAIVQLRPAGRLIVLDVVRYAEQMKPAEEFEKDVMPMDLPKQEVELAKNLTEMLAVREFHLDAYADLYNERMTKLVEAKVAGEQIVEAPQEEPTQPVINLMEALERSLAEAKAAKTKGKPPMLVAPGTADKAKAVRRRKSS